MSEILLNDSNSQLCTLPIKYPTVWDAYKKQVASFWTAEEIDLSKDYDDFCKLSDNSKHFIKMILGFFAASDTIVNINLGENFTREITVSEIKIAYQYQIMMENIHSEMYALQIQNIIKDTEERTKLFEAVKHFDCIKKKAEWAFKWIEDKNTPFVQRVIAFAIVEGIFFSGSFAAIFWLKDKNIMPGLCESNELIARDEGMHTEFACLIKSLCSTEISERTVHLMFKEAVDIEKEFICDALPCSLLGMNKDLMSQYIECVADRLLVSLKYNKIWNSKIPFDFIERLSLEGKTNFFESRPTQYQKSAVLNQNINNTFEVTEDF
uniref:Ribonucleoside-diphosphate reductase small chain n=1 Tax=Megaviridae environmental sample TaxID=1737588 RepID=A0A5J6VMR4_9VIRU|nr:MAG: ribonucleotide reductase, small chain [Megaviridae environmental sample]